MRIERQYATGYTGKKKAGFVDRLATGLVMKIVLYVLFCILVTFLLCACRNDENEERVFPRVLIVYLGGDSNLSGETLAKVSALQDGWQEREVPVLVYVDDASMCGSCLLRLAWEEGYSFLDTLAIHEEENSASAGTLRRVVEEVLGRYPAASYGLLLFSHASGWLPAGTLQYPLDGLSRSLIIDDGEGMRQEMELADFASALPDGMFDFIVFETCLTANVELVHALRHKTAYIVASAAEIVSPGFTPVYPVALASLLDTRGSLVDHLREFAGSYFDRASGDARYYSSATISVIATAALDELASMAHEIYREVAPFTAFDDLQRFDRPGQYGDVPALARYFDLEQYVERVASPAMHMRFREVMERVILHEWHTSGFLLPV